MARTRRPLARGTRRSSGIESGVTFATNPSGVTVDNQGITTGTGLISTAELDYLTGSAGYTIGNPAAAKLCVSGVSAWAGTTVTLVTGLTAISSLITSVYSTSTVSQALSVITLNINNNPGCASAAIQFSLGTLGATNALTAESTGCSIAFIAFGT
uniref:Uncharacterized protein n=1 Tax=viral metagenome TaxID=1070528 RepID=A0A6M3JVW5_9ZZZZ